MILVHGLLFVIVYSGTLIILDPFGRSPDAGILDK